MKILLFTPAPPNKKSSGSLMLHDLCKFLKKNDSIYCFIAKDPLRSIDMPYYRSIKKYKIKNRLDEIVSKLIKWLPGKKTRLVINKIEEIYIQKNIINQTVKFGKENEVDCVWAVLQGKTLISSALTIAKKIGVPLMTQVWDDPTWFIINDRINEKNKMIEIYDKTIKNSVVCATASVSMAENYMKKYKIKTTIFLGSLNHKMAMNPAKNVHPGNTLKIGFAGQMYAKDEWTALVKALDQVEWKINNRFVQIYLIGNLYSLKLLNHHIKVLGYLSQEMTIKKLAMMDILYLPYWFDKKYKIITQTSFPSKLTTYLASGRPVIFHGPVYSSPAKFIKINSCGLISGLLNGRNILKQISMLLDNPSKYETITKAGYHAFNKYLTYEKLNKELNKFLSYIRTKQK